MGLHRRQFLTVGVCATASTAIPAALSRMAFADTETSGAAEGDGLSLDTAGYPHEHVRALASGKVQIKETVQGVDIETDLTYSGPVFGFMFKW